MALTDRQIKLFKPNSKDQWLLDGKCLRLLIKPSGAKYWRLSYRFDGKQKTLALGVYPDTSLKQARLLRDEARLQIAKGIDPAIERKREKHPQLFDDKEKFSSLALEWWNNQKGSWTEEHAKRVWQRLRDNSFAILDSKSIVDIEPQDVLQVVRSIESRDALDVAKRVLQSITVVFRYGVQTGKLKYNPAVDLVGVVKNRKVQHRASLPNNQLGQFLRDLDQYEQQGRLLTKLALQLLVLTFVRPGELRTAHWCDFEFDNALWRIPPERMKMKTEHLVPLSKQVLEILTQLQPISGAYDLVFPSDKYRDKSMSDNTMRKAMFIMGYDGNTASKAKATPHGFRANASSILNEQGFNPDAIERQLSHMERNGVRAAYLHHARYLDERTDMMQWWADYLDKLKIS